MAFLFLDLIFVVFGPFSPNWGAFRAARYIVPARNVRVDQFS